MLENSKSSKYWLPIKHLFAEIVWVAACLHSSAFAGYDLLHVVSRFGNCLCLACHSLPYPCDIVWLLARYYNRESKVFDFEDASVEDYTAREIKLSLSKSVDLLQHFLLLLFAKSCQRGPKMSQWLRWRWISSIELVDRVNWPNSKVKAQGASRGVLFINGQRLRRKNV